MRQIKKGSTDRSVVIRIIDSTDGTPENGVVYNTSGINLWYRREGATKTLITEASLAALDTTHTDGGIILIGDGYYRLDLPDAAWATGANHVMIGGIVTGMIVIGQEVQLVNYDPEDAVRLGLTALPNAEADAAGGLPISDAGGLDLDAKLANTNEVTAARMGTLTDWLNGGRLDLILDIIAVDVAGLDGAAMRGTDNAALASAWTATRAGYIDLLSTYLDVAISSRLASAGYTAPDNTNIGNIHTIVSSVVHGNAALKTLIDALNDLSQTDIRTAIGMATANMDAQLAAIAGYIDAEITAIINAIAALNNLSEVQVNAQCDLAISDAGLATAINLAAAKTVIDAIVAKTNNLPSGIKKGVALNNLEFVMVLTSDHVTGATGLTVTGYIAKDGGASIALTGTITEKEFGVYNLNTISIAEITADIIRLRFTAPGADDRIIVIKTVA